MPITKHLVSYANDVETEQTQSPPAKKVKKPRSAKQLANDQRLRDKHASLKASKQTAKQDAKPVVSQVKEKVVEKTVMPSESDLDRIFNSYLEKNKHRFTPQQAKQKVAEPVIRKEEVIITDEPKEKTPVNVIKKDKKAFEKPEHMGPIDHKWLNWM